MSTNEYLDMYYDFQNNDKAKYRCFVFDIINSKNLNPESLLEAETILFKIVCELKDVLKSLEISLNKKILISINELENYNRGINIEPFFLGDMVGITIYNNSVPMELVLLLFDCIKKKYYYNYPLHYASGVYETNIYAEGNEKLYRGYVIDILSNLHKENHFPRKRFKAKPNNDNIK